MFSGRKGHPQRDELHQTGSQTSHNLAQVQLTSILPQLPASRGPWEDPQLSAASANGKHQMETKVEIRPSESGPELVVLEIPSPAAVLSLLLGREATSPAACHQCHPCVQAARPPPLPARHRSQESSRPATPAENQRLQFASKPFPQSLLNRFKQHTLLFLPLCHFSIICSKANQSFT